MRIPFFRETAASRTRDDVPLFPAFIPSPGVPALSFPLPPFLILRHSHVNFADKLLGEKDRRVTTSRSGEENRSISRDISFPPPRH